MSSEIIPCPACQHPVRVPESLFGQAVRCPQCKAYFTAPTRDAEGNFGAPMLLEGPLPPPEVARQVGSKPTSPQSPVFVAGLFLLLVGVIGTIVNGFSAVWLRGNPEATQEQVVELFRQFAKFTKQEFNDNQEKEVRDGSRKIFIVYAIAASLSMIPVLGAIAILRMRMWWLAFLGSVVAMLNVANGCCLIGLPTGIYCLIKLFDPEIRPLFSRSV